MAGREVSFTLKIKYSASTEKTNDDHMSSPLFYETERFDPYVYKRLPH